MWGSFVKIVAFELVYVLMSMVTCIHVCRYIYIIMHGMLNNFIPYILVLLFVSMYRGIVEIYSIISLSVNCIWKLPIAIFSVTLCRHFNSTDCSSEGVQVCDCNAWEDEWRKGEWQTTTVYITWCMHAARGGYCRYITPVQLDTVAKNVP